MGDIAWLASYPKSGNTWLRAFLTNLLFGGEAPADINKLGIGSLAASRRDFDHVLSVESSDMSRDEIERWRPAFYRKVASASASRVYLKIHDAYVCTSRGEPLVPAVAGSHAVYIVRNPLDVAVSFAHHAAKPIDSVIASMSNSAFAFGCRTEGLSTQLEQRLLTWSEHVLSWLDQTAIPVHLMRYEDMLREPLSTFSRCVEFLGIEAGTEEIQKALRFSSFEVLNAQERARGFREKPSGAQTFFRTGKAGAWREQLISDQARLILKEHSQVMLRLGYLSEDGSV